MHWAVFIDIFFYFLEKYLFPELWSVSKFLETIQTLVRGNFVWNMSPKNSGWSEFFVNECIFKMGCLCQSANRRYIVSTRNSWKTLEQIGTVTYDQFILFYSDLICFKFALFGLISDWLIDWLTDWLTVCYEMLNLIVFFHFQRLVKLKKVMYNIWWLWNTHTWRYGIRQKYLLGIVLIGRKLDII